MVSMMEISFALVSVVAVVMVLMVTLPLFAAIMVPATGPIIAGGGGSAVSITLLNMWPLVATLLVVLIPVGAILRSMRRQEAPPSFGGSF